ncbi:hypothetical protein MRS44_017217 [Fusarium solani]|uniref:uncharacterized protein n=1 Tax=Fusarium solani TaxID=169388 RepID=UPI0032C4740D|nr:hypothetical protein MRS44_017217 [Fusarium solani]
MASTSSTSFEKSLELFRKELSKDQLQKFNGANLKDLNNAIQEVQAKLGRDKRLCNFRRLEKFLSAMEHVEQLVTIFLNVHEVVAFVWGPIKLALMAATTFKDSIRQLLDVYEEIGEALSNLAFFHTLIRSKGAEHLRLALEDYFSDILRFHHCVLKVFSRPNWKTFFIAAWGSFRRQAEPIIRALRLRQGKLSHERLQSHAIHEGVRDFRVHADDRFDKLEADLEKIRSTLASEYLRSQTSSQDRDMKDLLEERLNVSRSEPRSRLDSPELSSPSAGDWIFSDPAFQSWEGLEGEPSSRTKVLFLSGSPGAGKTTLARKVIRYLKGKGSAHGTTVYFFFNHADKSSAKPMLRTILSQLIQQDEPILRYLYMKCSSMDKNIELSSIATLQDLVQDCLTYQPSTYVVLDGLDECAENEPNVIITWFLEKVLPRAASRGCHLRLFISGQRDGRLDQLLSAQPQIRLDTVSSHQNDIEEYSKSRAAEICARFSQTPEQEDELASKVTQASQGMFLYAQVVMDNFLSMGSIAEFEYELESDKFPYNLDKAYERIVQRVVENSKPWRQKTVKKILGWIICAKTPLRWREIQSRFCIDVDKATCNFKRRCLDSCKEICSSLVDVAMCELFGSVQSEQIVHMVHETASKYLIQRGTINLLQEHADMALFCCRYLSSRPFLADPKSDTLHDAIRSGYFGFIDYAAVHYSYHVQEALDDTSVLRAAVVKSAVCLLEACSDGLTPDQSTLEESSALAVTNSLCAENTKESVQYHVATIQAALESRHDSLSGDQAYLDLSGPMRFKCPRIHCSKFATGFRDKDARYRHFNKHKRPFICADADCFAHVVGCESQQRLEAHMKAFHQDNSGVAFPSTKGTKPKDIFEACKRGNLEEVKRFYSAGVQLNESRTMNFITPLYIATQAGHTHVCKYLIDQGINPFRGSPFGTKYIPMFEAIQQQNAPMIELFIHTGLGFENEFNMPQIPRCIAIAILAGLSEALGPLLEHQSCSKNAAMIEDVLRALIRVTQNRKSAKRLSADSYPVHVWFRRVFPNLYHNGTSVSGADSLIKRPDSAEYRTCKKTLFQSDNRFLRQAIAEECHPLTMFLLDLADKDDLQVTDDGGCTPMHILAEKRIFPRDSDRRPTIAQRIIQIDGGASANTPDKSNNLPVYTAVGNIDIATGAVQTLIAHTDNLNHRNSEGISVIERAATEGHHVSMLLKTGRVDLFDRNEKGQTSFFSSAINGYKSPKVDVLEMLLEAAPTLAWTADDTEDRLTPLHHAKGGKPYWGTTFGRKRTRQSFYSHFPRLKMSSVLF